MRDDLLDALLIPARGIFLIVHFGFLRCRRRKACLALPRGSHAVITKTLSAALDRRVEIRLSAVKTADAASAKETSSVRSDNGSSRSKSGTSSL